MADSVEKPKKISVRKDVKKAQKTFDKAKQTFEDKRDQRDRDNHRQEINEKNIVNAFESGEKNVSFMFDVNDKVFMISFDFDKASKGLSISNYSSALAKNDIDAVIDQLNRVKEIKKDNVEITAAIDTVISSLDKKRSTMHLEEEDKHIPSVKEIKSAKKEMDKAQKKLDLAQQSKQNVRNIRTGIGSSKRAKVMEIQISKSKYTITFNTASKTVDVQGAENLKSEDYAKIIEEFEKVGRLGKNGKAILTATLEDLRKKGEGLKAREEADRKSAEFKEKNDKRLEKVRTTENKGNLIRRFSDKKLEIDEGISILLADATFTIRKDGDNLAISQDGKNPSKITREDYDKVIAELNKILASLGEKGPNFQKAIRELVDQLETSKNAISLTSDSRQVENDSQEVGTGQTAGTLGDQEVTDSKTASSENPEKKSGKDQKQNGTGENLQQENDDKKQYRCADQRSKDNLSKAMKRYGNKNFNKPVVFQANGVRMSFKFNDKGEIDVEELKKCNKADLEKMLKAFEHLDKNSLGEQMGYLELFGDALRESLGKESINLDEVQKEEPEKKPVEGGQPAQVKPTVDEYEKALSDEEAAIKAIFGKLGIKKEQLDEVLESIRAEKDKKLTQNLDAKDGEKKTEIGSLEDADRDSTEAENRTGNEGKLSPKSKLERDIEEHKKDLEKIAKELEELEKDPKGNQVRIQSLKKQQTLHKKSIELKEGQIAELEPEQHLPAKRKRAELIEATDSKVLQEQMTEMAKEQQELTSIMEELKKAGTSDQVRTVIEKANSTILAKFQIRIVEPQESEQTYSVEKTQAKDDGQERD